MNPKENEEIKNPIKELLNKGKVRGSLSPCVLLTVLSPKNDESWRMCTYARAINNIIVMYMFPFPRIDDLMDCLNGARHFSKIDFKSGYHQIRMREGDEGKQTFNQNHEIYDWLVMPFGLKNAPNTYLRNS